MNRKKNKRAFFQDIFGAWSKADYKEFKKNLSEVEKIDPDKILPTTCIFPKFRK